MKPSSDKDGYLQIGLRDKYSKRKWFRMHRLVAMAFIDNPLCLEKINHIDGNVKNNYVLNLEWCNDSWNNKYRHILNPNLFKGENSSNAKHTNEEILEVYKLAWKEDLTQKEIGDMFRLTRGEVSYIKNGQVWQSVTNHDYESLHRNVGEVPLNHIYSGELNSSAKLTNTQVLEIYDLAWNSSTSNVDIAKQYKISSTNVRFIKYGKTWNSITHHNISIN